MTNMNDFEKSQLANAVQQQTKRAKIIVAVNTKGGAGKSTVLINLAYCVSAKYKVLVVDADEQGTSYNFCEVRKEEGMLVPDYMSFDKQILKGNFDEGEEPVELLDLDDLVSKHQFDYDYIVIDTPGVDSVITRMALTVADTVFIPTGFTGFDINALARTITIITECKNMVDNDPLVLILPNKIKKSATNVNKELKSEAYSILQKTLNSFETTVEEQKIFFMDSMISERSQYARMHKGQTIFELVKGKTLNPTIEYRSIFAEMVRVEKQINNQEVM